MAGLFGVMGRTRSPRKPFLGNGSASGLRPSRTGRVVVLTASTALVVAMAQPAAASAATASAPVSAGTAAAGSPAASPADASQLKDQRPDAVSAAIQAKAIKAPVEITGARTEFSTTYALPNGAFRVDRSAGPVRVSKPDGSWADVDLGLVQGKDGWTPTSSPRPVTFSAGGSGPAAVFEYEGRSVSVVWPDKLPAPTIDGATATYALSANEDLVLQAGTEGLEESLVIKKRPAADDPAPMLSLPMQLKGVSLEAPRAATDKKPGKSLTLNATDDGSINWAGGGHTDGRSRNAGKRPKVQAGDQVFAIQQASMYSAARDAKTGLPSQTEALAVKTVAVPSSGPAADADTAVAFTADKAFLDDPDTQYPVTIDPTITADTQYGDTWLDQGNPNTSNWSSSTLKSGLFGSSLAGTLIGFNNDNPVYFNQHVTSASLSLYNMGSGSCTASPLTVYPLTGGFDSATTWNTGATDWRTDYSGTKSFAHGFSTSCAAASESIDVTSIVSAWAFGDIDDYGFFLQASATDASQSKTFCSMDLGAAPCNVTSHEPTLSLTYNSYPWVPKQVAASPQVTGTDSTIYVTSLTPSIQAKIGNTDGSAVSANVEVSYDPSFTADGTGVVWSGTGAATTPDSLASVTVGTALTNGKHYQYRVRGAVTTSTGGTDYGPWSSYQTFKTHVGSPVAPTVSCTSYAANTWTVSSGSATCTIDTTSGDGSGYWWALDNPSPDTLLTDTTNTGAAKTATIVPTDGQHTLYARARDVALSGSTTTAYTFGIGNGGILTPITNATTQKAVGLIAQSSSARTQVTYSYRAGTDISLSWITVPTANVTPSGSTTPITAWPETGTITGSQVNYTQLNWNAAATIAAAGGSDGAIQIRACFTQSGANSWCTSGTTFTLAKTDFAASSATADIGPGSVSLTTGNYEISANDASVGGLSIGRTTTSLVPAGASTGPAGVFGAGWRIDDFGPTQGAGDLTLTDLSANGFLTLKDPTGTETTYIKNGTVFTGTGDANDGSTLVKSTTIHNPMDASDTANYTGWQLTDVDGTVTSLLPQTTGSTTYVSKWINGPGSEDTSGYTRDANGRVIKILAPSPSGVTCISSMVAGCQALNLSYATSTTATGTTETTWGEYNGLVKAITYTAYNPATSSMTTTSVASYLYDNSGHLRAEWDPRISPALKTRYTYDANGRPSTVTPPGRAAWTMAYDSAGRLADVSRTDPTNGLAKQSVVYDIAISGTGSPFDLSSTQTTTWNQTTDLPYTGAALFPASDVPATGTVNGVTGVHVPTTSDWPFAALTYLDVSGLPVNNAVYGAGAWQIGTTRYDASGRELWSLTAGNRARALNPSGLTDPYVAAQASSATRADLLATINTYSSDDVDLLSTLGPAHQIHLASGAWASARVKTTNTYDEGSPAGAIYHLLTTTATSSVPLDGTATTAPDTRKTLAGYDPIDGASSTGTTSGWTLHRPTTTTTVMGSTPGSADIVKKTRYDSAGRVIETRMPESSGSDAGTTSQVYYTADTSAAIAACRSTPQWAGLLCQSGPIAQPVGTTIPTTVVTYSMWGTQATITDTSGSSSRTTTNTYDAGGRLSTTAIAVLPVGDGGTAVPTVTVGYDSSTGDTTTWTASGVAVSAVYNSLGQRTSYTDADGNVTSMTYTLNGQIKTRNDGKGTTAYTYDGTDASGLTEHRGLPTTVNVGMGTAPSTFTAAYDQDGNLIKQVYPNGIIAATTYDDVSTARSLHYTNHSSNWMSYDQGFDRDNHAVWSTGPLGETDYGYDNNNRLISVRDDVLGQCATRQYTISKDGNRTALTSGQPAADGSCQTSSTTTVTSSYDAADRATTTGYVYDKFGRTTTTPAAQVSGTGDLTTGYFSNDMAASLTQGAKTKTFTLDPARRLRQATDTSAGSETNRIINHYSDANEPLSSW